MSVGKTYNVTHSFKALIDSKEDNEGKMNHFILWGKPQCKPDGTQS